LKPGFTPKLIGGGNAIADQVTLDLCSSDFPSEALRVARHQVAAIDAQQHDTGISIEAVLYGSPADAQQAMREVRNAKAKCPNGYVNDGVAVDPLLRYTFAAAPDGAWAHQDGIDRFAVDVTLHDQAGHSAREIAVYQQHGSLLVVLYTVDPVETSAVLSRSVEAFTHVLAQRMSDLPASAVQSGAN
jgi:hypothetical protein